ncbi:MAG: TauD/TfdA family dioxygenase [Williamsia sp.]|nr:TauD/TfdA family dioxygenase [Williamsia sp.]
MKTKKIEIGSNVYDIDIKNLSQDEIKELQELLYQNRIIVVKNQSLTEQDYVDFAYKFGFPEAYLQSHYNHPDYPLIFVSSNVKKEDGRQLGVARTGGYWHSDTAFEKEPKIITMLMPKVLPKISRRTTRFIDMSAVYNALPAELLEQIEEEDFIHSGRYRYKVRPEDAGLDIAEILELIDYYQPPVHHPAVIEHPVTGEKIIYGSRGFTIGISNKDREEQHNILKSIFDFAETNDFVKEVQWEMGDLIIWDNRFLVHSSGRAKAPTDNIHEAVAKEEETMMYRITMKDAHPLYAAKAEAVEAFAS